MTATMSTAPGRRRNAPRYARKIVVDALGDGITCGHCRRARSVTERECTHCDAPMRGRG
ncbi:MAG: hypothetical protein ACRDYU_11160 [Actinomycetes bacterium]